jgi:hypothetical protein
VEPESDLERAGHAAVAIAITLVALMLGAVAVEAIIEAFL